MWELLYFTGYNCWVLMPEWIEKQKSHNHLSTKGETCYCHLQLVTYLRISRVSFLQINQSVKFQR